MLSQANGFSKITVININLNLFFFFFEHLPNAIDKKKANNLSNSIIHQKRNKYSVLNEIDRNLTETQWNSQKKKATQKNVQFFSFFFAQEIIIIIIDFACFNIKVNFRCYSFA